MSVSLTVTLSVVTLHLCLLNLQIALGGWFSYLRITHSRGTTCILCVAFIEVPVSQVVPVGSEAVFRCRHLTADFITWGINGTSVGRSPPPDITPGTTRDEEGSLVDTLTVVARLEYNKTVVVCVVEFFDGTPDETSEPPALLLVQGECLG